MKTQITGAVLLGVALLAGQVRAEIINFDNLGSFATVTNQYPNVIFSASGGDIVLTTPQNPPYLGSQPNLICTSNVGATNIDCVMDITLTFTTLVDNITFTAYGNQEFAPAQFALADVYQNGILTHPNVSLKVSHTVHCGGSTNDCAGDPQSLPFTGISMVIIHGNSDFNGTAYDDFAFTVEGSDSSSTPEPSTLLLVGLCGIVWAGRRCLARKSE